MIDPFRLQLFAVLMAFASTSIYGDELSTGESLETGTRAKLVEPVKPRYPRREGQRGVEGWVLLNFVVQPDGSVVDPIVEDSSGVKSFEKAALRVITSWKFEPATWNGRPVEQSHTKQLLNFSLRNPTMGATRKFVRRYTKIQKLISKGGNDEAIVLLSELFHNSSLSLYELSRAWLLRSDLAAARGEKSEQLSALRKASVSHGTWMEPETYSAVLRQTFWVEIELKMFSAALATYGDLKKVEGLNTEISNVARQIVSQVKGSNVLGIDGAIEHRNNNDEAPYWSYSPMRKTIGFSKIEGKLERLEIRCDWKRATDTIEVEKTWTIPKSWGQCKIFVFGDEGASFKLLEFPSTSTTSQ